MTDTITITGLVATTPRHLVTGEGLPITSFRLASTQRRYDRRTGEWVDGETNWYTISAFRQLAISASRSIAKGDRVLATGRLRIRDWNSGDRSGTTIEVEADALGHDLTWGSSRFTRTISSSTAAVGKRDEEPPGGHATPTGTDSGMGLTEPRGAFDPDAAVAASNAG